MPVVPEKQVKSGETVVPEKQVKSGEATQPAPDSTTTQMEKDGKHGHRPKGNLLVRVIYCSS